MYQALYRKYRPKDFDNIVGQENLVKTLKNSIINDSFSHAYMFFGPRGTGKTTLSKIFARSINCLNSIDGCCCNECEMCKYSLDKECVDIIEIDAASNNGVDEIRELRNKINLVPSKLKYKVYIIDEVHMLSIGAFNALLKTLEEPPKHIVFILATTDPQKVPETIISRCQCFSFERISENNIVKRLQYVCQKEKIDIDTEVLKEIAYSVDGGMRDALSILDKLRAFCNGKILLENYYDLNGLINKNDIKMLVDKIFLGQTKEFLKNIENFNDLGKNIVQIITQVLYYIKDMVMNYYIDNVLLPYDINLLIKFILILNEKMFDIKKSNNPLIFIEMLILDFINTNISLYNTDHNEKKDNNININLKKTFNIDNIKENKNDFYNSSKEKQYEDKELSINICNNNNNESVNISDDEINELTSVMNIRVNNTFVGADKNILKNIKENINILNDFKLDEKNGYLACTLLDGSIRAASQDFLIISYHHNSIVKQNLLIVDKLTDFINEKLKINVKIALITDEKWEIEKKKYISNLKNGIKYNLIEEPVNKVFKEQEENVIINDAIELFGDIVEIE